MNTESGKDLDNGETRFEIAELDDQNLEEVSGGNNAVCHEQENTNCAGANCVSGCGG